MPLRWAVYLGAASALACSGPVGDADAQEFVLGPEAVASVNDDGGLLQVEPAIALADSLVVVAWNDSWAGREHATTVGVTVAWSYSLDAGRTFRFGGYLPDPAEGVSSYGAADSWLVYDGLGTVYLQILHWPDRGEHEVRVYGLDVGRPDRFEFRGVAARSAGADKPALAVGPAGGLVSAYSDANRIFVVASSDGGRTWTGPVLVSEAGEGFRNGADVTVCGGRTVIGWIEPDGVWVTAGEGTSFAAASRIRSVDGPVPVPPGYSLGLGPMSHIPNNVYLDCERPGEAGEGGEEVVHLTYVAPVRLGDDTGSRAVAHVGRASEPAGQIAWSEARFVSDGDGRYQAFPAVDATPVGVAFLYYDWRDAKVDAGTHAYVTIRRGRGSWDVRVSDVATRWEELPGDREHAVVQRNVGDYISIDGEGGRWVAAWTDGRTGRSEILVRTIDVK